MNTQHLTQSTTLLLVSLVALMALTACPASTPVVPDPVPKEDTKPTPKETTNWPPPVSKDVIDKSGIREFDVDGLKVILKPTPNAPVVAAQLLIRGGVTNAPADTPGIENFSLSVATNSGTQSTPKDAYTDKLNSIGSSISYATYHDYSAITVRSLRSTWGPTFKLLGEVLTEPVFDPKQVELSRARILASIKSQRDTPDDLVRILASDLHFDNHPYKTPPVGTFPTVEKLTPEQLQAYYKDSIVNRNRMTLIVVGDFKPKDLEEDIRIRLKKVPAKPFEAKPTPPTPERAANVSIQPQPNVPTNYMIGFFEAPSLDEPDYYPSYVAFNILSDRLFEEIRTKRNLTYAVYAGMSRRVENFGLLYVTTTKPNETVRVMFDQIQHVASNPIDKKDLSDLVSVFLTEHYMKLETHSAQATTLAVYEVAGGGWEQSLTFIDNVKKVTPEQIMDAMNNYAKKIQWGVVGNPVAVDAQLLKSR